MSNNVLTNEEEKKELEGISNVSLYAAGVNTDAIKYSFEIASRYLTGTNLLEMGPAEGVMTDLLANTNNNIGMAKV